MVEGFLLLVDAAEGVLPGTRFVLQKALQLNLRPIVFINKSIEKTQSLNKQKANSDLFLDLAIHESQLTFPSYNGSSRFGFATTDMKIKSETLKPLFDFDYPNIPAPEEKNKSLQYWSRILTTQIFWDHRIGRVFSGNIEVGQQVICCRDNKISQPTKITKIYKFYGLERIEANEALFWRYSCSNWIF